MATVQDLANAIAKFEGFFASGNTVAKRNNNPGNLRYAPNQTGTDKNGYAIFANANEGWNALYRQIGLDQSRGLTLRDFIYKYAPPSDNNPTSSYLDFVSKSLGVGADESLNILVGGANASPTGNSSGVDSVLPLDLDSGDGGAEGIVSEEMLIAMAVGLAAVIGFMVLRG